MVVFVHVDDILAHAQATMAKFAAELGRKFKVKSMVEKFDAKKAGSRGVHVDGNNDTARHCESGTRFRQVLDPLEWRITKRRRCRAYITCFTRTSGGSRSVSKPVDSA